MPKRRRLSEKAASSGPTVRRTRSQSKRDAESNGKEDEGNGGRRKDGQPPEKTKRKQADDLIVNQVKLVDVQWDALEKKTLTRSERRKNDTKKIPLQEKKEKGAAISDAKNDLPKESNTGGNKEKGETALTAVSRRSRAVSVAPRGKSAEKGEVKKERKTPAKKTTSTSGKAKEEDGMPSLEPQIYTAESAVVKSGEGSGPVESAVVEKEKEKVDTKKGHGDDKEDLNEVKNDSTEDAVVEKEKEDEKGKTDDCTAKKANGDGTLQDAANGEATLQKRKGESEKREDETTLAVPKRAEEEESTTVREVVMGVLAQVELQETIELLNGILGETHGRPNDLLDCSLDGVSDLLGAPTARPGGLLDTPLGGESDLLGEPAGRPRDLLDNPLGGERDLFGDPIGRPSDLLDAPFEGKRDLLGKSTAKPRDQLDNSLGAKRDLLDESTVRPVGLLGVMLQRHGRGLRDLTDLLGGDTVFGESIKRRDNLFGDATMEMQSGGDSLASTLETRSLGGETALGERVDGQSEPVEGEERLEERIQLEWCEAMEGMLNTSQLVDELNLDGSTGDVEEELFELLEDEEERGEMEGGEEVETTPIWPPPLHQPIDDSQSTVDTAQPSLQQPFFGSVQTTQGTVGIAQPSLQPPFFGSAQPTQGTVGTTQPFFGSAQPSLQPAFFDVVAVQREVAPPSTTYRPSINDFFPEDAMLAHAPFPSLVPLPRSRNFMEYDDAPLPIFNVVVGPIRSDVEATNINNFFCWIASIKQLPSLSTAKAVFLSLSFHSPEKEQEMLTRSPFVIGRVMVEVTYPTVLSIHFDGEKLTIKDVEECLVSLFSSVCSVTEHKLTVDWERKRLERTAFAKVVNVNEVIRVLERPFREWKDSSIRMEVLRDLSTLTN